MKKEDCRVGMKVFFGRPNGEKTLGIAVKLNPKKMKVQTLEDRGKNAAAGTVWNVPYTCVQPADDTATPAPAAPERRPVPAERRPAVEYGPWMPAWLEHTMMAIVSTYAQLSPECLYADGERSRAEADRLRGVLIDRLGYLQSAVGAAVSEADAIRFADARDAQQWNPSK